MNKPFDEMAQTISDAVNIMGMELNTLLRDNNDSFIGLLEELNDIIIALAKQVENNRQALQDQKNIRTTNLIIFGMNIVLFLGCWGFYVLN